MWNKHYDGQGFVYRSNRVDKVVTVRLSEEELAILKRFFPGHTISYGIRSAIHTLNDSGKKCNTSG